MASKKRRRRLIIQQSCSSEDKSDNEDGDALWHALRKVQRETSCSTKTLLSTLRAITPFLKADVFSNARHTEKNMFERSGATCLKLNGCIHCDAFVFLPSDKRRRCPDCDGDRFNADGVPNEVLIIDRQIILDDKCVLKNTNIM